MPCVRLTQDEFERRVEKSNPGQYEILSEYKKQHEKVLIRHKECGYEWMVDPWNLMAGKIKKCPLCSNKWKRTTNDFKKEVYDMFGDEYEVIGEYKSTNSPILIRHRICGNEFMRIPRELKQGVLCPKCRRPNYYQNTKTFSERLKSIQGGKYELLGEYKGARTKTEFLCKKCGEVFSATPDNIVRGHGCPKCTISKGEDRVERWLKSNGLIYEKQYSNKSCKSKRALRFDFAVKREDGSIAMLIEYDGVQHFRPVRFNSLMANRKCEQNFAETVERDEIKTKFCKDANIPLLRISYKELNQIEKILERSLRKIIPCQAE